MSFNTGMTGFVIVLFSALTLLVSQYCIRLQRRIPKGTRLPPGPPGKPIIGNSFDMHSHYNRETFSRWAKEYGDIVYLNVLGKSIVVINSRSVAFDLFEKSSSIYSDRVEFPMLNDLIGFDWNFAFMRYGDWWRRHRKIFHQKFHPSAVVDYHGIQTKQTKILLREYLDTPGNFVEHIHHCAAAVIMEIVYGIKVLPKNDHYVDTVAKEKVAIAAAGNPGTYFVDMLPFLKYIPEWIPGAGFKRQARIWRKSTTDMSVVPFTVVKNALRAGTAGPSFTASCLEEASNRPDTPPDEELVIRGAGSSAYSAGADTMASTLHTFMLAMIIHPEAQKKAQAELDAVIGPYRLPEFGDCNSLPYVNAICKELLRWRPATPLGIAHNATQDNIYRDYFIPKGAIIIGNIWYMLRDEATYGPETDKFVPERFLVPGVQDPNSVWGFGRRICPGRYMADNSLFIAVASILAAFDIGPACDNNGKEIPVEIAFTSGFTSHPKNFQCTIRPRSESAEKLLQDLDNE